MSPPKSSKARNSTVPQLDFSKKLRIIRAPKSLTSLLASERHTLEPKQVPKEYQSVLLKFQTQFPPLCVTRARKLQVQPKKNDTTDTNDTQTKPNIKVPEWTIIPPASKEIAANEPSSKSPLNVDQVTYTNGNFFYLPDGAFEMEKYQMHLEDVADLMMRQTTQSQVSRVSFTRSSTYIRYSMTRESNNTTKVFGKDCMYYTMRVEDYIFLLDLLRKSSTRWAKPLTWPLIRWLLGQLVQPRNFPSIESEDQHKKDTTLHVARKNPDAAYGSEECRFVVGQVDRALMLGTANSSVLEERRVNEQSIPPALAEMSLSTILNYRKMMGPYITDEVYAYLINLFELMTGTKEYVSAEAAFTEVRARLGVLTPTARILREVIEHWKSRRIALGKPLLREFWPVPSANDNSPFAVFRARTKEKMTLRRPRRSAPDAGSRFGRLAEEFQKTENLFAASRRRDWIKLQLCDVDAMLFEQLWKERRDPSYKHPGWDAMDSLIRKEIQFEQTVDRSLSDMKAAAPFLVPVNIAGFGDDQVGGEEHDGSTTQRHNKRRRVFSPFFENGTELAGKSVQQQPNLYHIGKKSRRLFVHSRPSDAPSPGTNKQGTQTSTVETSNTSITKISKISLQDSNDVYVSPVPLPPIYLCLDPLCSKEELGKALSSVGVVSMTPVGVLEPSIPLDISTPYINYQCQGPSPTAADLVASPISKLPFSPEVFHLRRTSESPSVTQAYVYRQSLESLPPKIRHPSNLRTVIPYGRSPKPFSSISFLSSHRSTLPFLDSHQVMHPFPVRACIRTGRSGKLWLDRYPCILPTSNLLVSPPLDISISPKFDISAFHDQSESSINPFAATLQSYARRVKRSLQQLTTVGSPSEMLSSTAHPNIIEIERTKNELQTKGISASLQCADDRSLLLYSATTKDDNGLQRYITCRSFLGFTIEPLVNTSSTLISSGGYTESGFYPTGVGGPESSLNGCQLVDTEPGIAGPLGFDALSNSGGFGLFCLPRHANKRLEFWEELSAKALA